MLVGNEFSRRDTPDEEEGADFLSTVSQALANPDIALKGLESCLRSLTSDKIREIAAGKATEYVLLDSWGK